MKNYFCTVILLFLIPLLLSLVARLDPSNTVALALVSFCGLNSILFLYVFISDKNETSDEMNKNYKKSEEVEQWKNYLNEVVGLFCFGCIISALTSSFPQTVATISLMVIFIFSTVKNKKIDGEYRRLQKKKNKTPQDKKLIDGIIKNQLSITKLFRDCCLYFITLQILSLIIILNNDLKDFFKIISSTLMN